MTITTKKTGVKAGAAAAVFFSTALLGSVEASPASAAPVFTIYTQTTVGTDMYAAPGTSTPVSAHADAGNDLAVVCKTTDSNNQPMVLAVDLEGAAGARWAGSSGYVPAWTIKMSLYYIQNYMQDCWGAGTGEGVGPWAGYAGSTSASGSTGMYVAPGLSTPMIGTAHSGQDIAALCQVNDNRGQPLVLSIDRDGQQGVQWTDTAGFIWAGDLAADNSGLPGCL